MNLCYVYNEQITYSYFDALEEIFEEVAVADISKKNTIEEKFSAYIVDIASYEKEILNRYRAFFKNKANPLVFLLASNGGGNGVVYQLAYMIKAESIFSKMYEPKKLALSVTNAVAERAFENKVSYLGRLVEEKSKYLIVHKNKLSYANKALMDEFSCDSLEDVEHKVCSKFDIEALLSTNDETFVSGEFFSKSKFDIVKSVAKENEHVLFVERFEYNKLACRPKNELTTRVAFVEFLKERLHNTLIENGDEYCIVSIKIDNFKKIGNVIGKAELELFLQDFVHKSEELLWEFFLFCEYYHDFFVAVYKNRPYDSVVSQAEHFYTQIDSFFKEFNFKVDIVLHVAKIGTMGFDRTLLLLDSIRAGKISKKDIATSQIKYIGKYKEDMSDKEIIALLLDDSFINDADLKLVNVYKGMVIDSPTKILKKENDAVYVVVSQMQGAAMSVAKETVIRSDIIKKDIKAQVVYVDRKRKIAKLENFKVVDPDPMYKDGGRVDFAKKNVAIVSLKGMKLSATIVDISVNSITLSINKIRSLESYVSKEVEITFSLPTKRLKEGEVSIVEKATVSYIDCKGEGGMCRILCEFLPGSKNKKIINEYIHLRKIEILTELKKLNY